MGEMLFTSSVRGSGEGEGMLGRIWRWGVVVPVTVLAIAGGIADVATASVDYWYLLAPSYFVIAISVWRGLGERDEARRQTAPAADGAGDAADDAIVARVQRASAGSVVSAVWQTFLRFLFTFAFTFMAMVLIWMAISIATWARGYWYICGPIFALIAWFVWSVMRSGRARGADKATPAQKLVR